MKSVVTRKWLGQCRESSMSAINVAALTPPSSNCLGLLVKDEPRRFRSVFAHGRKMPFKNRAIDFVDVRIGALKSTEIETPGRNDIVKQ
jgi:hypothetical protein